MYYSTHQISSPSLHELSPSVQQQRHPRAQHLGLHQPPSRHSRDCCVRDGECQSARPRAGLEWLLHCALERLALCVICVSNVSGQMLVDVPSLSRIYDRHVPVSIPRLAKSIRDAANLSRRWFVSNIWLRASNRLDRCHGSLTALICLDSVMEEQSPFGAPNDRIILW